MFGELEEPWHNESKKPELLERMVQICTLVLCVHLCLCAHVGQMS